MSANPLDEEAIFNAACQIADSADRAAHLREVCQDAKQRARIESLLAVHDHEPSFLKSLPPVLNDSQFEPSIAERPGSIIGPYKLLEQVGEGGMGVVFMAEQLQPIQRKVALKIIKPGMDTRQVIARFEAERQALALMDHPNIAKVLEAGTTTSGRPYFVMELVRGIPLTEFCDLHKLTIRQRLELLVSVCQAVQHAHQKGIIHRDLKPGNVLVTMHDGQPVVKVIDFGVAKATGQKLTEKTLFTGLLQMIGTPLYMSPEQAELSNLDVDTRSDIYSLGMMLYELLTGTTPFDSQRLKAAAFDEIRRIIREEEPPRPSTRLSTLAQQDSSTISEKRNIDPRQLSKLFRGELDWIVMKCLEKDRNRRYETASALGADLEHYLCDEPVQACPPSKVYRLRKLARHNRGALITASLVLAALILGLAGTTWQAFRATHAEQQTKASEQIALKNSRRADAISEFLINAFRSPDPARDGRGVTMAELLDRAVKDVEEEFADDKRMQADLLNAIAKSYEGLGLYRESVLLYRKVQGLRSANQGPRDPGTIEAMGNYASAYESAGQFDKAIPLYQDVLQTQKERLAEDDPELLATTTKLAWAYNMSGQSEKALALFQNVLRLVQAKIKTSGPVPVDLPQVDENPKSGDRPKKAITPLVENAFEHLDDSGPNRTNVLVALSNLAKAFAQAGQVDQAIPLYQQTLKLMQEKLGPDDPMTLSCMYNLAMAFKVARRFDEATPIFEEVLRRRREKFGPDDPVTVSTMTCVGVNYDCAGNHDKCVELFGEVLRIRQAKLGHNHPETVWTMWQYGASLCDAGREKEALPLFEKAFALSKVNPGIDHPTTLGLICELASAYKSIGRFDGINSLAVETLKLQRATLGPDHPATLGSMRYFAKLYDDVHLFDEALALREEHFHLTETKLGSQHGDTIASLNDLVTSYESTGRLDDAAAVREKVLRHKIATLGPNHRDTVAAKNPLALMRLFQGKVAEAETLLTEDSPSVRAQLQLGDGDKSAWLHQLALANLLQNKFTEAEPLARESAEIRKKIAPDDWSTFSSLSLLGGALLGQKKYAEAEPLLLSGYEGMHQREDKISAVRKVLLRQAIERLVQLYQATNQPDKAGQWKETLAEYDTSESKKTTPATHN